MAGSVIIINAICFLILLLQGLIHTYGFSFQEYMLLDVQDLADRKELLSLTSYQLNSFETDYSFNDSKFKSKMIALYQECVNDEAVYSYISLVDRLLDSDSGTMQVKSYLFSQLTHAEILKLSDTSINKIVKYYGVKSEYSERMNEFWIKSGNLLIYQTTFPLNSPLTIDSSDSEFQYVDVSTLWMTMVKQVMPMNYASLLEIKIALLEAAPSFSRFMYLTWKLLNLSYEGGVLKLSLDDDLIYYSTFLNIRDPNIKRIWDLLHTSHRISLMSQIFQHPNSYLQTMFPVWTLITSSEFSRLSNDQKRVILNGRRIKIVESWVSTFFPTHFSIDGLDVFSLTSVTHTRALEFWNLLDERRRLELAEEIASTNFNEPGLTPFIRLLSYSEFMKLTSVRTRKYYFLNICAEDIYLRIDWNTLSGILGLLTLQDKADIISVTDHLSSYNMKLGSLLSDRYPTPQILETWVSKNFSQYQSKELYNLIQKSFGKCMLPNKASYTPYTNYGPLQMKAPITSNSNTPSSLPLSNSDPLILNVVSEPGNQDLSFFLSPNDGKIEYYANWRMSDLVKVIQKFIENGIEYSEVDQVKMAKLQSYTKHYQINLNERVVVNKELISLEHINGMIHALKHSKKPNVHALNFLDDLKKNFNFPTTAVF